MRRAIVLLVALLAACRTTRPAGEETPVAPLTSTSPADAARELAARREQLTGQRSLLRIRATSGDRSQSFRAQLQIDNGNRMLLTAYTPLGTTAIRLYADASEVTFINDLEGTWWHGSAAEFARSFGFFGAASPYSMALLIAGLPAEGPITYDYAAAGLSRANVGDVSVTYDPPSYPPTHVTIVRGAQKLEIETLESAMTTASVAKPSAPNGYRCCVAPRL
ncbi:MAG TPA: hypothetical protein VHY33_14780 [Thermoanaerobaculia bacterium]|jgi:hypothetical protein|nr:hypothetical protein [Thermoanaerobaculia bacterium]